MSAQIVEPYNGGGRGRGCGKVTMVDKSYYDALTKPGDQLQSAASRMAAWIVTHPLGGEVPYEVCVAAFEAQSAVEEWTEARSPGEGEANG